MALQGLEQHGEKMDEVYRWTRHVYDWTRPFFLFGRDALVDGLDPPLGGRVCELGCGTAHNLIRLARRRPDLRIIGVDASSAMLEVAQQKIVRAGLQDQVVLVHGYAESFAPSEAVDAVLFPYSLSMMPEPELAIQNASGWLRDGGAIHVVDFGDLQGWPGVARKRLLGFLNRFEVYPRPELFESVPVSMQMDSRRKFGGYSVSAIIRYSGSISATVSGMNATTQEVNRSAKMGIQLRSCPESADLPSDSDLVEPLRQIR
jgi:S-adenosylmethionine-diacylgycerolhomoserine-N-methlytransferase